MKFNWLIIILGKAITKKSHQPHKYINSHSQNAPNTLDKIYWPGHNIQYQDIICSISNAPEINTAISPESGQKSILYSKAKEVDNEY